MRSGRVRRGAFLRRIGLALVPVALGLLGCPAPPTGTPDPNEPNEGNPQTSKQFAWYTAFDARGTGALSYAWGLGPDAIYAVGGKSERGEMYFFDGVSWSEVDIPQVPFLVWVFGFSRDDIFAVGEKGTAIHWDGVQWTVLNTGTNQNLWGVWGRASNDVWVVGGNESAPAPTILHWDGAGFTQFPAPPNDRYASILFKVWGIGAKTFAVGQGGLIVEFNGTDWVQVPSGEAADDDFISLWGVAEDKIVAVGGRGSGRIATYDGVEWRTTAFPSVPGLSGVFMVSPTLAVVGGNNGFVGAFNPKTGELTQEEAGATDVIHGVWGTGDRTYAMGGRFSPPYSGLALVRDLVGAGPLNAGPPARLAPDVPPPDFDCNGNNIEDATDIASGSAADCDGNGVPDSCEADSDGDGVADACDICPGGSDEADADLDGVPDLCDLCPLGDDAIDSDADGVADACDVCAGDDSLDADKDGVPDACDVCPGFNDKADADGDGVPDGCDVCAAHDDRIDTDGDGIPNGCDTCVAGELDSDGDGLADACDGCPTDPNKIGPGMCGCGVVDSDADGDGVCDGVDKCPGFNDKTDSDADGVADGCDRCQGGNDKLDSDGDTIPNQCDQCPGADDRPDVNGDSIPDCLQTLCADQTLCDLGFNCVGGICLDDPDGADLEIGTGGGADPNAPAYMRIQEGGVYPVYRGFQGFVDMYATLRMQGFTPGTLVNLKRSVRDVNTGQFLVAEFEHSFPTSDEGNGVARITDYHVIITLPPDDVEGRLVDVYYRITNRTSPPTIIAEGTVRATLQLQ